MDETLAEAVANVKAAAAAHKDTYVAVAAADLAEIAAHPAVKDKTFAVLAGRQLAAAEQTGEEPKPIDLHRTKHLEPLLKAVAGG